LVNIIVKNQIYVKTDNVELVKNLKNILSKENPEYYKKKSLGFYVDPRKIPPRYDMFKRWESGIIIPRGTGKLVRELCNKYNLEYKISDFRTKNKNLEIDIADGIEPFWYQRGALDTMLKSQQGLIVAPCGSGKTVIAICFIGEMKVKTLIVTHTMELLKQWKDELKSKLQGRFSIGQFGNGVKKHGDITIALIQTLSRMNKKESESFFNRYSCYIADEAHHWGANSFVDSMHLVDAYYMFGLTATPKRKDGRTFLIDTYLGKIIHSINPSDLEMSGRLVTCKINVVNTNINFDFGRLQENYILLGTQLAKDLMRNDIIKKNVMRDLDDGKVPMIITERKTHAMILKSLFEGEGFKVAEITGRIPPEQRDSIKMGFKRGEYDILVANKQIAAEGLDLPQLDSVHIVFYTNNKNLIKQAIGRGRRTFENKDYCRVWWYRDYLFQLQEDPFSESGFQKVECDTYKYNHMRILKWFKDEGFEVKEII